MADGVTRFAAGLLRRRWFVRAPIALFRARLGFLFGRRMLLLQHVGRRTGLPRYAVLEVVDHPLPTRWVVVSGFGERAQWYRNVRARPDVCVTVGAGGPKPARAHVLDDEQARQALTRYAQRHPRAWRRLRPVLEHTLGASIDTDGTSLPLVAIDILSG